MGNKVDKRGLKKAKKGQRRVFWGVFRGIRAIPLKRPKKA